MTRAARLDSEKIPRVTIGEVDLVSRAVRRANAPLCSEVQVDSGRPCTRAAGHHESNQGHASTDHVATDRRYVVQAVWS